MIDGSMVFWASVLGSILTLFYLFDICSEPNEAIDPYKPVILTNGQVTGYWNIDWQLTHGSGPYGRRFTFTDAGVEFEFSYLVCAKGKHIVYLFCHGDHTGWLTRPRKVQLVELAISVVMRDHYAVALKAIADQRAYAAAYEAREREVRRQVAEILAERVR